MLTQKSAINIIKQFAQQINESGIELNRVILYGSFSRNEQHEDSDIDVALVSDKFKGNSFYDMDLYGKTLIKKEFHDIHPRTYKTQNFRPDKDPFVGDILKTGIEIIYK